MDNSDKVHFGDTNWLGDRQFETRCNSFNIRYFNKASDFLEYAKKDEANICVECLRLVSEEVRNLSQELARSYAEIQYKYGSQLDK